MDEHKEQLDRIERKMDRFCLWMTGNGHPENGVLFRLRTLENVERTRVRDGVKYRNAVWAFVIAILTAVGSAVANLWPNHKP